VSATQHMKRPTLTLRQRPVLDLTKQPTLPTNPPLCDNANHNGSSSPHDDEAARENVPNDQTKTDKPERAPTPSHPVMLTAPELRATLAALECNGPAIGKVIRANERTTRRWISGDLPIPPAVSVWLRLGVLVARNAPYDEVSAALRTQAELIDDWQRQRRAARKEKKAAARAATRS
jgi:hypothetical protein